ncbi:AraC family transcriptional regulator [Bdellovibrio svalbardensis]|uniref:AraC family transcriptional regulator n=1 Tax=Bdellovibrio svalbardensis TaxID=2972972 RepID=A0ABT6DGT9_9BACT|nr:AraC family transcriptional regulator [Bdellovibrio svalbardensis]MDG0815134.1 AraC family transcriptional regulator [Bdellovibrio svalbardensis]
MSDHGFRVFKAITYIDQNLFAQIDLESIASAGAFSPFHFHRVFTSLMGMTVNEYVRKRRLSEAARRLIDTDQDILDLALECQYESQEAFTRAFKKAYDMAPGQLRKMKKSMEVSRSLTLDEINALIKGDAVKPEVIKQKAKRLVGIAKAYGDYDFQEAHDQWDQFAARWSELKPTDENIVYGIRLPSHPLVNNPAKNGYVYLAGIEVGQDFALPTGMTEVILPAGNYAKFTHKGHLADSGDTARKIWNVWMPESGLKILDGLSIEAYGPKFDRESANSEFDILVPIHD